MNSVSSNSVIHTRIDGTGAPTVSFITFVMPSNNARFWSSVRPLAMYTCTSGMITRPAR